MIDRLGKFLGVDIRYYLAGGGYLVASQTIAMVLLFASTWFLTNLLPKEGYGAYGYVQSLLGMLTLFTLPGYYNAVIRSTAKGYHGALLRSAKRRMLASIAGTVAMLGIGLFFYWQGDTTRAIGCIVGSGFVGLAFGLDDFRAFLNGRKLYRPFALYNTTLQAAVTGATIAALLITRNFVPVLAVNLAVRGFGQLICTFIAARHRENDDIEEGFDRFGWKLSGLSALGNAAFYLDRVLIGSTFSLSIMADYTLASVLTNPLRNIGVTVNRLVFPKMVDRTGAAFSRKVFFKAFWLIAGLAAGGVVFALALPFLLRWFFPHYTSIAPYAIWMAAGELTAVLVIYLETYYLSQDRLLRTYYFVNVARPLMIIVVLPTSLAIWGIYGAIISKLVIRAAEAVFLMIVLSTKGTKDIR